MICRGGGTNRPTRSDENHKYRLFLFLAVSVLPAITQIFNTSILRIPSAPQFNTLIFL